MKTFLFYYQLLEVVCFVAFCCLFVLNYLYYYYYYYYYSWVLYWFLCLPWS